MYLSFAAALSFFLATYVANGANMTLNNTSIVHPQTDGETVVCNQYIGQDANTHEAIKKLDEKLDKLIKLMQPSPNPGKYSI